MVELLESDDKYLDFKKAFENGEFAFNCTKLVNEIKSLHITRSVRSLTPEDVIKDSNRVITALINNQVTRSRIVEIKMSVSNLDIRIKSKVETLEKYLLTQYASELQKMKLTQTERKNYIQSLFDFTDTVKSNIDVVQRFADLVIDDIDQASWALKSIIDCLKINDAVVKNSV